MLAEEPYHPDRSLLAKTLRQLVRLRARQPARGHVDHPMISFTFDDGHVSAVRTGAACLAARGLRGTFFIAAGLLGGSETHADWDDIARLGAEGHEIGCHTFSHLDCGSLCGAAVEADVDRNREALIEHGLAAPVTFAYPFGNVPFGVKAALGRRFALMRGVRHGLVGHGTDLSQTPAVGIQGTRGEALAGVWLGRAAVRPAWLILITHDVRENPSPWGCTRATLARLIECACEADMDVVTVAEGARRLRARCNGATTPAASSSAGSA